MPGTAMPEAAIDKHRDLGFGKHKIGFALQRPVTTPSSDPVLFHQLNQTDLGPPVPLAANRRHVAGPLFRRVDVSHGRRQTRPCS